MSHHYRVLTTEDITRLRLERVAALEADICRAELQLEDAESEREAQQVAQDVMGLQRRLEPHYAALGLMRTDDGAAPVEGDPAA